MFRSRLTYTVLVAVIIMSAAAGVAWRIFRPVFFTTGSGPSAPSQFDQTASSAVPFVDITGEAGFTHRHCKPQLDRKLEPIMAWVASVGAAAAAGDFNNDGWIDLYVTNSRRGEPNWLYRNKADGTFVDVAAEAGVAGANEMHGASMDCVWGDFDNDGHPDLYVVKWGRDILYRNQGDGTFMDVTDRTFRHADSQPGSPWANGCSATWFDYDRDGWLDLYVGNYFAPFDLWNLEHTRIMHDDFEQARNAGRNALYRNNQDGTFTDVAPQLALDDPGWTLSVGHGDINNDGWPDLYCANDFGSDQMFLNQCDGTFLNITDRAFGQDTKKGMNVDFGDFDGDGWLDIYVTNITTAEYLKEGNMLWHNDASDKDGVPVLLDTSVESGAHDGGWGWGAKFFDFDNDGDLDIVSVNGFITAGAGSYWYDLASWTVTEDDVADALNWPPIGDRSFSGNEATRLFRNEGSGRFTEMAGRCGLDDRRDGRGVVTFDYDNDGDLDVYIANQGQHPVFFKNNVGSSGHWLALDLEGSTDAGSTRSAIGARVTIVSQGGRQIRELDGGNSYCGQSDRRVYFGLGDDAIVDTLEIRWPSGQVQRLRDQPVNQLIRVTEPNVLPPIASLVPTTRQAERKNRLDNRASRVDRLSRGELEALLSGLEDRVRERPDDISLASRYRGQCVEHGQHDRSMKFFEQLAVEHPSVPNVRLQLSAAYIDKIPTCGGMAAIVSKGTLARRALDQQDMLIESDANWWPAVYARAMNHLHWPRALRHSKRAARDFRRCIAIQTSNGGDANDRSYYVRAYIGLGDALAKDGNFDAATRAWRDGLAVFPGSEELKERIALNSASEARDYVEKVRNLEQQIDTDFSFLLSP